MARILEEETGQGAFPAVLHCFTGGPDLARRAIALGLYISFTGILTFKNSTALRAIAAELPADRILVETDAPYLAPGPFRGKRNEPAYVVETAKVLAETRGVSFDEIAQQTTENFFRLFSKVPRPATADAFDRRPSIRPPHDAEIHHSRLRLFCGVPRPGPGLGRLRSEQSEKPPPAHVAAGRAATAPAASRACWSTPRPICASSCSMPRSTGSTASSSRHEHADHTHGIDDLRALFIKQRRRLDSIMDEHTAAVMRARFGYCFQSPPGSEYPPIVTEHRLTAGQPVTHRRAGRPDHGAAGPAAAWRHSLARLPLRQRRPIPATSAACRRRAPRRWAGSMSGSSMRYATGRTRAISR